MAQRFEASISGSIECAFTEPLKAGRGAGVGWNCELGY